MKEFQKFGDFESFIRVVGFFSYLAKKHHFFIFNPTKMVKNGIFLILLKNFS